MANWRTQLYRFLDSPARYGLGAIAILGALLFGDWKARGAALLEILFIVAVVAALSLWSWWAHRRLLAARRKAKPPLNFSG
ncbi:MAG TPA: hypothetical protein VHW60_06510 [Caulobacteraceae bacterium]|jgi:hypothetical protein|nr:hypothetical protein [Caulobacteraceae bacterium]